MRRAIPALAILVLLLWATPACFAQAQFLGEWSGTFDRGGQTGHLLWHVVKAADGSVTATFDNVDEGVLGIKVKTLTFKDANVTALIDDVIHPNGQDVSLAGTFTGKLSEDGNEVTATWTQTQPEEQPAVDIVLKREQAAPAGSSPQPK